MIRLFAKLWRALKGAPLWVQALESLAREDYVAAKDKLINYSRAAPSIDPEFHLLMSLVEYKLCNHSEAFSELKIAREHIQKSKRYTWDDKNYMLCFSDRLLNKLPQKSEFDAGEEFLGDFTSIRLEQVQKGVRLNFPL